MPLLVRVTVFELLVLPTNCPPKLRLVAETLTTGAPATAVKVAVTAWLAVMETAGSSTGAGAAPAGKGRAGVGGRGQRHRLAAAEMGRAHGRTIDARWAAAHHATAGAGQAKGEWKTGPLAMPTESTAKSVQTPPQLVRLNVMDVIFGPVWSLTPI